MINKTPYIENLTNDLSFEMIPVDGGTFLMGSEEKGAFEWEGPVHSVTLNDFYVGKFVVTQALWQFVMGKNPSRFKGIQRPVENVSWEMANIFIHRLNNHTNLRYRLLSEIEWEFAARGGNRSEGYIYSGSDRLEEVGWYYENSGNQTQIVGQKMANEIGIYDMSGNIWEWVEDQWHSSYDGAPNNGIAWVDQKSEVRRVRRGGSWDRFARYSRVSYRVSSRPGYRFDRIGFRLAISI